MATLEAELHTAEVLQRGIHHAHGIAIAAIVGTTFFVALRTFVRIRMLSIGIDDYIIIVAWALMTAYNAFIIVVVNKVSAFIAAEFAAQSLVGEDAIFKLLRISNILYAAALIALKISITALFLRIIPKFFTWTRRVIYTTVTISTLYGLVFLIMSAATCGTTQAAGLFGVCDIQTAYSGVSYSWSIENAVTDFIFAVVGIVPLRYITIPQNQKIAAGLLLVFGSVGGIASVVRAYYIITPHAGFSLGTIDVEIWTIIEVSGGITASSLATMRPLLVAGLRMFRGQTSTGSNGSTSRTAPKSDTEASNRRLGNGVAKDWTENYMGRDDQMALSPKVMQAKVQSKLIIDETKEEEETQNQAMSMV